MVTKNTTLQRNQDQFITSELGDEVVVLDLESGNYISMNPIGALIWNLIEKPRTYQEIITSLIECSDVDPDVCSKETEVYLNNLKDLNMVITHGS